MTRSSLAVDVDIRLGAGESAFGLTAAFDLEQGITALRGRSGSGKTTMLNVIAGHVRPIRGIIRIGDCTVFDSRRRIDVVPELRRVGLVAQDLALFPHLTAAQNVGFGLRRASASERRKRVDDVISAFAIRHLAHRRPPSLSGGERQRVALARALVTDPAVLLLDEALGSLDLLTKAGVIDDLKRWVLDREVPVILVTHDEAEFLDLAGRELRISGGQVIDKGSSGFDRAPIQGQVVDVTDVPTGRGERTNVTVEFTGPVQPRLHVGEDIELKSSR